VVEVEVKVGLGLRRIGWRIRENIKRRIIRERIIREETIRVESFKVNRLKG
jgi:hypothetical protein